MGMSRRSFIHRVGQAGGYSAAYMAMQGLGLAPSVTEAAEIKLEPGSGKGVKIVILGAGMAGLSSGYELKKAGYDITILEAHNRYGGHNWTLRKGTKVDWTDGTSQTCEFDDGLYINCGPARLPSHHQTMLGYAKELGVELEVEVNASRSGFLWNSKANAGKPMMLRRAINDTRGHVSELLAKAVNQGSLDKELTPHDKERMVAFLKQYGDLSPDLFYKGSARAGYKVVPGAADQVGVPNDPLDLSALLDQDMFGNLVFEDTIVMQATMFQPVGGMDMIPRALGKKLAANVKLMSEVTEIRRTDANSHGGVRIAYKDLKTGKSHEIKADYCICTIPLPVLAKIPADFSQQVKDGLPKVPGGNALKIGFQSRRFWEQDYQIYGGISFTKNPTALIWNPSTRYHTQNGVIIFYGGVGEVTPHPLQEQVELARAAIDGVYPGHGKELGRPVSVMWEKIPYHLGTGARFSDETQYLYNLLNQPDGPFYFANDYLSHVSGWQEGAIRSGYHAANAIAKRHREARL